MNIPHTLCYLNGEYLPPADELPPQMIMSTPDQAAK